MPAQSPTTTILLERELVIYRRERSSVWQCRFKVDNIWQRASTKERDEAKAKKRAKELMIAAEIRKHENLPVVTRKFRDVAKQAIRRMEEELAIGSGKRSYEDYIRVIKDYLIPALGNKAITNVTYVALDELNKSRAKQNGGALARSTLLMQNAALNRVFDEAVIRNFMNEAARPKLEASGKKSERRAAFELEEIRALLGNFDSWLANSKPKFIGQRTLMRDYVEALLDTGARPGKELLNLKWKEVQFAMKPELIKTGQYDEDGEEIEIANLNRTCTMVVTGKTGTRKIIGRQPTVAALERIARRNYNVANPIVDPFKGIAIPSNDDYVFRLKDKTDGSKGFQKMFERYLKEHNLLIDPITGQSRVFYSLRHTYATLALTYDEVAIHTLAKQMGTSAQMIEQHYSHLDVIKAIEQLRGEETRKLLNGGGIISDYYSSIKAAKLAAQQAQKQSAATNQKSGRAKKISK